MELSFLGGANEVGRSAILLESDKKFLLDYGVKLFGGPQYPRLLDSLDVLVTSHAHLDHIGQTPVLFDRFKIPWITTYPTQPIAGRLLIDSMKIDKEIQFDSTDFDKLMNSFFPLPYEKEFHFSKTSITFHDAGHIPGSAMTELKVNGKKIVYTGDFNSKETKLHNGAKTIQNIDTLIIESTYSNREHPDRKDVEKKLKEEVKKTLDDGGTVLLPCFAVGRTQEMLQVLDSLNLNADIYLEGMGAGVTNIILDYPSYIRDAKALKKAFKRVNIVTGKEMWKKKKAMHGPGIIVASGGMLEGGPAIRYVLKLNKQSPKSKVIFTGYGVENTNARYLLEKGIVKRGEENIRIDLGVEYLDFSAHSGKSDLLEFIKKANPEKVFCVHGDHCPEFAERLKEQGYEAYAPKLNETHVL
ncbi:MBL fold metallo-hydrolase [Candidatus Micrarchaeota archaeon]|nr:MBL fold metallo-hydrolase [Candidatus Micrarchaeota archaeon]